MNPKKNLISSYLQYLANFNFNLGFMGRYMLVFLGRYTVYNLIASNFKNMTCSKKCIMIFFSYDFWFLGFSSITTFPLTLLSLATNIALTSDIVIYIYNVIIYLRPIALTSDIVIYIYNVIIYLRPI